MTLHMTEIAKRITILKRPINLYFLAFYGIIYQNLLHRQVYITVSSYKLLLINLVKKSLHITFKALVESHLFYSSVDFWWKAYWSPWLIVECAGLATELVVCKVGDSWVCWWIGTSLALSSVDLPWCRGISVSIQPSYLCLFMFFLYIYIAWCLAEWPLWYIF